MTTHLPLSSMKTLETMFRLAKLCGMTGAGPVLHHGMPSRYTPNGHIETQVRAGSPGHHPCISQDGDDRQGHGRVAAKRVEICTLSCVTLPPRADATPVSLKWGNKLLRMQLLILQKTRQHQKLNQNTTLVS